MNTRWNNTDAPRGDDYDQRWAELEATGKDPHGEVAFIQRYNPKSVLDAGCGTGRVAIELDRRDIAVVGVDFDESMLQTARRKAPHLPWLQRDLASIALTPNECASTEMPPFDAVVMAGNVMIFLAPGTEAAVVQHLVAHLAPHGLLIAGFQLQPGRLTIERYDEVADAAGLALVDRFSTWDGDPWVGEENYAVSVHARPAR